MTNLQTRTPKFIVWYHNRGMDKGRYYAYRSLPTQNTVSVTPVNGLIWLATAHEVQRHEFTRLTDAEDAKLFFQMKFSNNRLTTYGIERIDLDDDILTDIDNLSEM